jgi:1-acyl-sn-glycerol-3-phosphate acyltransferase
MVYYGNESFFQNMRLLRRTDFSIRVGTQFRVEAQGKITTSIRRQITDEIMYRMAMLLPPQNRGFYSNLDLATSEFLRLN